MMTVDVQTAAAAVAAADADNLENGNLDLKVSNNCGHKPPQN